MAEPQINPATPTSKLLGPGRLIAPQQRVAIILSRNNSMYPGLIRDWVITLCHRYAKVKLPQSTHFADLMQSNRHSIARAIGWLKKEKLITVDEDGFVTATDGGEITNDEVIRYHLFLKRLGEFRKTRKRFVSKATAAIARAAEEAQRERVTAAVNAELAEEDRIEAEKKAAKKAARHARYVANREARGEVLDPNPGDFPEPEPFIEALDAPGNDFPAPESLPATNLPEILPSPLKTAPMKESQEPIIETKKPSKEKKPPKVKTEPMTDEEKHIIRSNLNYMTRYLLHGKESIYAVGREAILACKKSPMNWTINGANDWPNWTLPQFAGFFWWKVSQYRAENNLPLELPRVAYLVGKLKQVLVRKTKHELYEYIVNMAHFFNQIQILAGPNIDLVFGETSIGNVLIDDKMLQLSLMTEEERNSIGQVPAN